MVVEIVEAERKRVRQRMNLDEIRNRLADFIHVTGGEQVKTSTIERAVGVATGQFSSYKRRGSIPYKQIAEFCGKNKISINWVLFGQEMWELEKKRRKLVDVVLISSEEGNDIKETIALDPRYVEGLNISGGTIGAIEIEGDAMEPLLKEGSIVLFDKQQVDIGGGNLFVMKASGGFFARRLNETHRRTIEIISDNPLVAPEEVEIEDVVVLGKVVGVAKKI